MGTWIAVAVAFLMGFNFPVFDPFRPGMLILLLVNAILLGLAAEPLDNLIKRIFR